MSKNGIMESTMSFKSLTDRIDELNLDGYKQVKNTDWNYPNELLEYLQQHDFKKMGRGFFSEVWASDSESFVIKINMGRNYDENYLKFVEYCRNNKQNPHLPKMGKIKNLKTIDGRDFYILFIEKLDTLSAPSLGFEGGNDYNNFMRAACVAYLNDRSDLDGIILDLSGEYNIYHDSMKKQLSELVKIYSDMIEMVGMGNMDMETKNLMKRGNTLVITDPVF